MSGIEAASVRATRLPLALSADCFVEDLDGFERSKVQSGLGFASPVAATLVLANTLLGGSGLLGVPRAFAAAGYGLGVLLLLCFCSASAFGSHLLQRSARQIGVAPCSFYTCSNAVTPRWTWLIDGAVMVKCFGVGTSYLIIVGDLAPDAIAYFLRKRVERGFAVGGGFVVAATLACFRNLSALKYTAAGAVVIVVWTVLMVACFYVAPSEALMPCTEADGERSALLPCAGAAATPLQTGDILSLGRALPVYIFAFTCQQNVFAVANEIRRGSNGKMDGVIASAYLLAAVAFGLAGFMSYLTYGDKIASDLLKTYPQTEPIVQVTRMLYSILAIFSYPMQVHPSRASAMSLWRLIRGAPSTRLLIASPHAEQSLQGADDEGRRFALLTLLYLALSLAVAITVTDLGKILGVVGATGSTMVSYILPGLIYYRTFPHRHLKRKLAWGQLASGCVIMPVCLVLLFI